MDTLMSWAKENFDLISLLVGLAGIFIGFLSVADELKKRKENKRKKMGKE